MSEPYVRPSGAGAWECGNSLFRMVVEERAGRFASLRSCVLRSCPSVDWAPGGSVPFGPSVCIGGCELTPGAPGMRLEAIRADRDDRELQVEYRCCDGGVVVTHHLRPSSHNPVMETWTTVCNVAGRADAMVTRFDALNLGFGTSGSDPVACYLLGWLYGPRLDAPGRHAVPFPYGSWLDPFLFGDAAGRLPPAPEAWNASVFRLVKERLTRLPLRSGGRSTYDNHPWVTVMDPQRQAGLFAGFQWSGSWRIDAEHCPESGIVWLCVRTDRGEHEVGAGAVLTSPRAFLGLFAGDWDEAFNACRRYTRTDVLPKPPDRYPTSLFMLPASWNYRGAGFDLTLREVDAAAGAGFEAVSVDTYWWSRSAWEGEFSVGLGDFTDHRGKFPPGLRAVSDRAHAHGMRFGLWFEFERVDIRTANTGPHPWKPEWIVHRNGHPHRSWCQHVFGLCLGVEAAAAWALENVSRAIREYGVDWLVMDSNEWAVCDDPGHGHGKGDGEWAQVNGLYTVLGGLRERFPGLVILNCAGGGQRTDFGMMRFCNHVAPHDTTSPSAFVRQMSRGLGCLYPNAAQKHCLVPYPGQAPFAYPYPAGVGLDASALPPDHPSDLASSVGQFEWRLMNRLMGNYSALYKPHYSLLPGFARVQKELLDLHRELRASLWGDRYLLAEPAPIVERANLEGDRWEACEFVAPGGEVASIFAYRCESPLDRLRVFPRGLETSSRYVMKSYRLGDLGEVPGSRIMEDGIELHARERRRADIVVLRRA